MDLRKSIFNVLCANIVQLIASIIVTFFVPKIVSIDNYSMLKTYTLYTGYAALFSMGFYDGVYLKYGGADKESLNKTLINTEHIVFIMSQFAWSVLWTAVGIYINDKITVFFAITLFPANLFTFYKRIYLATGVFDRYKNGIMIYSISYMLLNCLFSVALKVDNVLPYYLCTISANLLSVIYHFICFKIDFGITFRLSESIIRTLKSNIKLGWMILLGNLAVNTIYSIDRWFVKIAYSNTDFAYYSFAVSMLNIIMVLIQSVGLSLYNYLTRRHNREQLKFINSVLLAIGTIASAGYFVLYYIITYFLPEYVSSLNIISISFAAYPYMIVINSVYLNLYKADKNNKGYIRSVAFMIITSCISNTIALLFRESVVPISFATTVSFILWYLVCSKDYRVRVNNEYLYLFVMIVAFFLSTFVHKKFLGLLAYSSAWAISTFIFFNRNNIRIREVMKYI